MAGINQLKQIHDRRGKEFLDNLLNNFVIINHNIDGTFFGIKKEKSNDRFKYFKKSGEITYVDRMLMKYYNSAITYFENLPEEKRNRIPSNFFFGFEYITSKDNTSSKLNRLPKNKLILSYIHKLDENENPIETLQTKEDLTKWANYLEVEPPQIIFEGKLDDDQKTAILDFVYSTYDDLKEKFTTTSFTKYILSILDEGGDTNFLKTGVGKEIDSIVFRFYDENDEQTKSDAFLAKIIDPIFDVKAKENKTEKKQSNDYIWLIVIDLMNHIEIYDEEQLRSISEREEDYDKKYIVLINYIFKDFIKEYSAKYEGLELEIPEYLKRPEFEIEYELISDPDVINIIKNNETYKEIYRILLNFFRKPRKKSSSNFFNPSLLNQLNIQIKKIKRVIMGDIIYEGLFPSFGEFIGEDLGSNIMDEHEKFQKKKKGVKSEKVNILIGSFQPIHNGHLKAAQKLHDKNGYRTVFISTLRPNKKYPLSPKTVNKLLNKVQQKNFDKIAAGRVVMSDGIREILVELKPDYEPILWGTDSRKIKDYVLQLDYIKKKNIPIRISDKFKLVELPTYQKSSDVRDVIKAQDYKSYKNMVPQAITSEFFNLSKEMDSGQ